MDPFPQQGGLGHTPPAGLGGELSQVLFGQTGVERLHMRYTCITGRGSQVSRCKDRDTVPDWPAQLTTPSKSPEGGNEPSGRAASAELPLFGPIPSREAGGPLLNNPLATQRR